MLLTQADVADPQNKYKFDTGANYKQCSYSPSLKMQKSRHL